MLVTMDLKSYLGRFSLSIKLKIHMYIPFKLFIFSKRVYSIYVKFIHSKDFILV